VVPDTDLGRITDVDAAIAFVTFVAPARTSQDNKRSPNVDINTGSNVPELRYNRIVVCLNGYS
jgi:hypothetical protein